MEALLFRSSTPARREMVFELPLKLLATTPAWKDEAANPPLAVRDAIRIGRQQFLELIDCETEWELEVHLLYTKQVDRWFYLLDYKLLRDPEGNDLTIVGKPWFLKIVVLMNGQTLKESPPDRVHRLRDRADWVRDEGWIEMGRHGSAVR